MKGFPCRGQPSATVGQVHRSVTLTGRYRYGVEAKWGSGCACMWGYQTGDVPLRERPADGERKGCSEVGADAETSNRLGVSARKDEDAPGRL